MIGSNSRTLRIGVLGCGVIAYWAHLRILSHLRGATLVAAADPELSARERANCLVRVPVYEQAQDVLGNADVDAVIICAPTHLHAELAIAACAAHKHFYLEKPLAMDAEEGRRVVEAAESAGVVAAMGFNRRLHPLYEQARELIAGGRLGRLRAVQTVFCEPAEVSVMPAWKKRRASGGGVLLDLASHHIDLLRWFLDDEVGKVETQLTSELTEHDTARVQFSMLKGTAVDSFFSFRAAMADFLEFIGERGTLRVDRHRPRLTLRLGRRFGYGLRSEWIMPNGAVMKWRLRRLVRPSSDPSYRRSLASFVNLLNGGPHRLPSLSDGLRNLEAILMAEASARSGGPMSALRD